MRKIKNPLSVISLTALIVLSLHSCKKYWPSEVDAFNLDMNFSESEFKPVLGRNTYYGNIFSADQSTLPLTFKVINIRAFDGDQAPELLKLFPVKIWKSPYTGLESSLQEIYAKRDTIMRPVWDISEHSGAFTMWNTASSDFVKTEPDSCYLFDVEVSNAGGRRYFRDLKLKPQVEIPATAFLGQSVGVLGDSTRQNIDDMRFWVNRKDDGNSITFKFLGPDLEPIKLSKFNGMTKSDWEGLVHGFNMKFATDSLSVSYDTPFPIPLVSTVNTKYNTGNIAKSTFNYYRIAHGGSRQTSRLELNYTIYQEGAWEIVVYFPSEAPLFDND